MKNMICTETDAKKKREIMKNIVKGKEAATELKILLQKPSGSEPSLSYHQLMAIVLTSFTQSLSIISSEPSSADVVACLNSTQYGLPVTGSGIDPTSPHCSEKRSQKGGRGRYNRRLHFLFLIIHTDTCFIVQVTNPSLFLEIGLLRERA